MGIQYVNRKGDTYRLFFCKTRTEKPNYYFSKKTDGIPVDTLPDGFEIFENPENAQVFLRKVKPRLITDNERAMAEAALRRHAAASMAIVDIDGLDIVVYLSTINSNEGAFQDGGFSGFGLRRKEEYAKWLVNQAPFNKMMRFSLVDSEKRLFHVERWCFKGSIDDWIFLDGPNLLPALLEKYVKHLGRESFFDLM